jgi:hypothetical protein
MLRKLSLVAVAAASLGAARVGADFGLRLGRSLVGTTVDGTAAGVVPVSSSDGPAYGYGYGGCYVRRLVPTPWGPRWRLVNRCY